MRQETRGEEGRGAVGTLDLRNRRRLLVRRTRRHRLHAEPDRAGSESRHGRGAGAVELVDQAIGRHRAAARHQEG